SGLCDLILPLGGPDHYLLQIRHRDLEGPILRPAIGFLGFIQVEFGRSSVAQLHNTDQLLRIHAGNSLLDKRDHLDMIK
ncbi:MAG: hypothetical protein NTY86_20145, partial [Deltaproteobacteria bacterium]|nr:hypothetical protein [Deltaproteobacteria bacterium]